MSSSQSDPDAAMTVVAAMRRQIEQTPMRPPRQVSIGWEIVHPLRSTVAAAALVGGIVALVLALHTIGSTPPAFAATRAPGGALTITLRDLKRIGALNARLARLGTRVRVVPVQRGCVAPVRSVNKLGHAVAAPRTLTVAPRQAGIVSITITTRVTLPDRTTVVAATPHGLQSLTSVVAGPAPKCIGYASAGSQKPFLIPAGQ